MTALWDAHFRARMLRQALSNDEMAQAVEAAERLEAELAAARLALEDIAEFGEPISRGAAVSQCAFLKRQARAALAATRKESA